MTAITKTVRLSNGISLPFLEQGDPSPVPARRHGLDAFIRPGQAVLAR